MKILLSLCFFFIPFITFAGLSDWLPTIESRPSGAEEVQSAIVPIESGILNTSAVGGTDFEVVDGILAYARDSIFALLMLISIGVFLYIGFKLITAQGNPEEFKKALMMFVYACVGIVIVIISWAVVRLVTGISF